MINVNPCLGYQFIDLTKINTMFSYPCNKANKEATQLEIQFEIQESEDNPPIKNNIEVIPKNVKSFFNMSSIFNENLKIEPITFYIEKNVKNELAPKIKPLELEFLIKGDASDSSTCQGGNIKNLLFTFQKNIFIEFDVEFITNGIKIDNVNGLPNGLNFKDGKIKGSPLEAGVFPFQIVLNDSNFIQGIIEVPNLLRLL